MKLKHLLHLLAACAMIVPAFSEEDTPLSKEMEKLNKALKSVKHNLAAAAEKDADLKKLAAASEAAVNAAKAACEAAAKFEPAKTKDIPEADKAKFVSDFKVSIEEVGKNLDALKAAIEAGKTDDAKALLDKLNAGKKEGHKKFKKEED